jgi:hypothetical protein
MVTLAQLAELWIVGPAATGSNPVRHPIFPIARHAPQSHISYLSGAIGSAAVSNTEG